MKSAWKWILGILIVVIIVAAIVAVPFVMRNFTLTRLASNATRLTNPNTPATPGTPNIPTNPNNLPRGRGFYGGPMMRGFGNRQGGYYGMPGPMMGFGGGFNRGFGRFSPFGFGFMFLGGFFRLLIPLALLGLLLWGVYQLGKRSGMRSTSMPAPVAQAPAAPAAPEPTQPENPDNPGI